MRHLALFLICCSALVATDSTRIAFGSCHKIDGPRDVWQTALAARPDLWIWAGDVVYADTDDEAAMRRKYMRLLSQPLYTQLRATTPVIGTWDDHDYGKNNAGAEFTAKDMSQQVFLDFLGVPMDSPRRERQGVYSSYDLGSGAQRVRVVLLDCRYHRGPAPEGTILGAQQWQWLAQILSEDPAPITLLVSGIQVLAKEHRYETWARYPGERQRLLELIDSAPTNVIICSGDRHIAEISRVELPSGRDLIDVTSSGMTHAWQKAPPEENSLRIGPRYTGRNIGIIDITWSTRRAQIQILPVAPPDAPVDTPHVHLPLD